LFKNGIIGVLIFYIFQTNLSATFVLKDELRIHPEFQNEIDVLGSELLEKTGVSAYVLILKTTDGESLTKIGSEELAKLPENSLILTFTELERKVDIVASESIFKLFDKDQVLSPLPWSGTILPILGEKIKQDPRNKYSVALFNGYADIVEQIAETKGVFLENSIGNANKVVINTIRAIFYGVIVIALGYIVYRKFFQKKDKSDV